MEPRLNPLDASSLPQIPAGTDKPAAAPAETQIRQGDADTIRENPLKFKDKIALMEKKVGK
jgi:hypothetical protein